MFGQSDSLDDSDGILSPSSNMTNRSLSSCLLLCHNYCIILYYCCVTYFYICLFWYFKPDQQQVNCGCFKCIIQFIHFELTCKDMTFENGHIKETVNQSRNKIHIMGNGYEKYAMKLKQ